MQEVVVLKTSGIETIEYIHGTEVLNISDFKYSNWVELCKTEILSETFIREHHSKFIWRHILEYQTQLSDHFRAEFMTGKYRQYVPSEIRTFKKATRHFLGEDLLMDFGKYVDWSHLCQHYIIPEEILRKWVDYIDFYIIGKYQTLSEEFIHDFKNKLNWQRICIQQDMSEDFLRKHIEFLDFRELSRCHPLSKSFIRDYFDKLDINMILMYQYIPEDVLDLYFDTFNINLLERYQKFSEAFIRKFQKKLCWHSTSAYQKLSIEFIIEFDKFIVWDAILSQDYYPLEFREKHAYKSNKSNLEVICKNRVEQMRNSRWTYDNVHVYSEYTVPLDIIQHHTSSFDAVGWSACAQYQKLPETFIRTHRDKIHWHYVSRYQDMSEAFAWEHRKWMDWGGYVSNRSVSPAFINKILKLVEKSDIFWILLSRTKNLTPEFIEKYKDKLNFREITKYTELSEDLIRKWWYRLHKPDIFEYQKLTKSFVLEHQDQLFAEKKDEMQSNITEVLANKFK